MSNLWTRLGLRCLSSDVEERFWRYIAYGFGVWWLAMAVQVFWPDSWSVVGFGLAVDGFFALDYMIWLMAAGLPIGQRPMNGILGIAAELKGLSLNLVVDDQLPRWVVGDPNRLRQVLTNLIANAIKFTHSGTVMVSAASAGPDIRFEVRDSGIDIAEEDHIRLFEPFTQVDGSRARKYGGAGLGLAICRQIATRQGGEIGVESQLGHGI